MYASTWTCKHCTVSHVSSDRLQPPFVPNCSVIAGEQTSHLCIYQSACTQVFLRVFQRFSACVLSTFVMCFLCWNSSPDGSLCFSVFFCFCFFLMTVQLPAALFIIDQTAVFSGLLFLIGSKEKHI